MGVQIVGGICAAFTYSLSQYFGFAIGMCVTVGGFAIGKVSGGSLNPAVSIGISSSHVLNHGVFWPCLVYTAVELVAGMAAAGVFRVTQPSEYMAQETSDESSEVSSSQESGATETFE